MLAAPRSFLFAPADSARKLERALEGPAGAAIADLEDAVAEQRKAEARATLADACRTRRPHGSLVVRMNALDTVHAADDLELVRDLGTVDALLVPKARAGSLADLPHDLPPLIALVETAAGILEAARIAAVPGVVALMIGTVDLAAELGVEHSDSSAMLHARSLLVLASAAAGLRPPIDGVWTTISDLAGLRAEAARSKALGFGAKAAIHPGQIETIDEVFAPTQDEVDGARALVAAAELALERGDGAISVEGRMVDRPVLERARRLVAAAEARA